ncbi:MAG: PHB depolymerase family esterase [Kofleriaceae bacterium]
MMYLAAALTAVTSFGSNPGALDMYEYIPANLAANRPLVVVMHGCTQTASAMESAGWNALADQYGFAVVYPQQRSANQALSCFNWYTTTDISRTGGEAESIIQMVDAEVASHNIDKSRVYVTGLSAGAAFTAVMLATYPDRFAAGSIMSGLPYKCATDLTSASSCQQMSSTTQKTAAAWGDLVRGGDSGFSGTWPRVQIWQGSSDYTVAPANATELVKQWTNVWGTDQTADATDTISTATRTQYMAGSTIAVELYTVTGMGHAIAIGMDPDGACPATSGAYFSDEKICSTTRAAQFFDLIDAPSGSDSGSNNNTGSDGSSGGGDDDSQGDDSKMGGGCNANGAAGNVGGATLILGLALARRRART